MPSFINVRFPAYRPRSCQNGKPTIASPHCERIWTTSTSILLIVWAKDTENSDACGHGGIGFRNHPLAYWLDYVRLQVQAGSPVLVVQTQCDRPEEEDRNFLSQLPGTKQIGFCRPLWFSA